MPTSTVLCRLASTLDATPAPLIAPPVSRFIRSLTSIWLPASIPIDALFVIGSFTAEMFKLLPIVTVEWPVMSALLDAAVAVMPPPPAASTLSVGSPTLPPASEKKSFSEVISTMPVAAMVKPDGSVVAEDVSPSNEANAPEAPTTAAFVESEWM